MSQVSIQELLDAGVHFGHQTRRWNPKMKPFIFEARNGIHIINLDITVGQLDRARAFVAEVAAKGGNILFCGTKKQAQEAVKEAALSCGQPHITGRWLGGTLTNLRTVKRSLARMKEIERMEQDGSINQYVKQEQSMLRRTHPRGRRANPGHRARPGRLDSPSGPWPPVAPRPRRPCRPSLQQQTTRSPCLISPQPSSASFAP